MGGFIAGVLATMLGSVLTMVWDSIKYYRERTNKDTAVLTATYQEMEGNIDTLKENKKILEDELEIISKEKKILIIPLAPLNYFAWEVVALNLPKRLIKDVNLLKQVRESAQSVIHFNEIMRSRENYRTNSTGMSNYMDRIKSYDQILVNATSNMITFLEDVMPKLK
jgi:hypothetical protein